MLGELIAEEQGEITSVRVLSTDGGHAVTEASFQAAGTLLGAPVKEMGTYESVTRADGTLFGEGQGIVTSAEGETATWHGSGVGHFTDAGGINWRGAIFYETAAPSFTRLNGLAAVFEFDTDEAGKATARIFAWI
ncbi:hypothetical protein ACM614_07605 [Streptomyces sp. 12297]